MKGVSFFGERVYPVLFMLLLTVVFISVISGIHLSTLSMVQENETLFLKKAVLYSAGITVPEDLGEVNRLYNEHVREYSIDGKPTVFAFSLAAGDEPDGYAFRLVGPGLWGEIVALVGYNEGLDTMTGIDFIKQNETPGLGARIEEEWYKEQFRGKTPPFTLVDEGTEDKEPDEVDSITGATYTSRYVRDLVNGGPERAAQLLKEVR